MGLGNRLIIGFLILTVLLTIITFTVENHIFRSFLVGLSSFITVLIVSLLAKTKSTPKKDDRKQ